MAWRPCYMRDFSHPVQPITYEKIHMATRITRIYSLLRWGTRCILYANYKQLKMSGFQWHFVVSGALKQSNSWKMFAETGLYFLKCFYH